jgi:predicted MFS family arabinose efflux permease
MSSVVTEGVHSRREEVIVIGQVVGLTVTGALPAFLTGALAVQVREDFRIGPALFGVATAAMFAVSAACSPFTGRVVQRRGFRFGYLGASSACALSLVVIVVAPGFVTLLLALAIGGVANALAQPAANLLLSQQVGHDRLGIAMGLKQSYIPIASILGGVSVPELALRFGWRWAVGGGALLTFAVLAWGWFAVRPRTTSPVTPVAAARTRRQLQRKTLLILTIGAGAGAAAATAMGVFLVDAAVDTGIPSASAGYLLAACSAVSLAGRVSFGWAIDRLRGHRLLGLVGNLMLCSTLGYGVLASAVPGLFVVGALVGYLGWSWTGILHLAVVNGSRGSVASATGVVQSGLALGAAVGPLGYGALAQWDSYQVAWIVAGAVGLFGVTVVRVGARNRQCKQTGEERIWQGAVETSSQGYV